MSKKKTFDLKPQLMRLQVTESAANTFTEIALSTPNLPEVGLIMEILRIYWESETDAEAANADKITVGLYGVSRTAMPGLNDNDVIWKFRRTKHFTSSGSDMFLETGETPYTDGNGNGLLYGRKDIILAIEGESNITAHIFNLAILFRLVKVSSQELIGLIT